MKTPPPTARTVFMIGPPGSGKTTVGAAVATRLGMSFHSIDDWVRMVYVDRDGVAMTDEQVDMALSLLFQNLKPPAVCEFAHHDYLALLNCKKHPAFDVGLKVALIAPLDVCLQRIARRGRRVRPQYVERSWHSTQLLIDSWSPVVPRGQLILDTTTTVPADSVERVVQFVSD